MSIGVIIGKKTVLYKKALQDDFGPCMHHCACWTDAIGGLYIERGCAA